MQEKIMKLKQKVFMVILLMTFLICNGRIGMIRSDAAARTTSYPSGVQSWSGSQITWVYNFDSKTIIVSGTGDMPTSEAPWKGLLQNTYDTSQDYVQYIVIDDGITSIANNAFIDDNTIKGIVIGNTVTKIGGNAFNCTATTTLVNGGAANQQLGSGAFSNLKSTCQVQYTKANTNFYNAIKGTTNNLKTLNEKGYITVSSAQEWYDKIMSQVPYTSTPVIGRFQIINDFVFRGTVKIQETNSDSRDKENYGKITMTSVTMDYVPYMIHKSNGNKIVSAGGSAVNLIGKLDGNGHKISGVTSGLFAKNYGIIENLNIVGKRSSANMWQFTARYQGTDGSCGGIQNTTKAMAPVAHINNGIIKGIDVSGSFYVSKDDACVPYDWYLSGDYEGGGISGINNGLISKCHVEATLQGEKIGGIAYENNQTIYGCSVEGTLDGWCDNHTNKETYSSKRGTTSYPLDLNSELGGISFTNSGTIEQSYSGASILSAVVYDETMTNKDDYDGTTRASQAGTIAYSNSGTIKNCSSGGFLSLQDKSSIESEAEQDRNSRLPKITTKYGKITYENTGTITGVFSGAGVRYTKSYDNGYGNDLVLTYSFLEVPATGNRANIVTLSKETSETYASGYSWYKSDLNYDRSHTCYLTKEDNINKSAHEYYGYCSYTSKKSGNTLYEVGPSTIHDHTYGDIGTSVTQSAAKSGDASKCPGLSAGDWIFANGSYPRPRESASMTVSKIIANYNGDPVEGTSLDKSKLIFTIEYSNGTVNRINGNDKNLIFPYGLYVANVGSNNVFYFAYNDPQTGTRYPETEYETFTIVARARRPVEILKVEYIGSTVTENMEYNPSDVRVTVKFDNGTQTTYPGSSATVGLTIRSDISKGDVDGNGVVNTTDYNKLKNIINNGKTGTMTDIERKQADLNGDNSITSEDLTELANLISRKVPLSSKVFWASYSGLGLDKSYMYKSFKVTSVQRKVSKIYVSNPPTKIKYIEDEDFEPKGMVITIKYDNNESQTLSFKDGTETFYGLSIGSAAYPATKMPKGQNKIPITYTENGSSYTDWLKISVRQVYLTSIVVSREPNVTNYSSGETFDERGMKITAYYDEGVYDDGRDNNWSRMEEIPINNCVITGGGKLLDSTNYLLIKGDRIDNTTKGLYGYLRLLKKMITSPDAESLTVGTRGTFNYKDGTDEKSITGKVAGNNYVTISYTENNITKSTIQPIFVDKKKLTKIDVFQMPHKTEYIVGDKFNTSGLIIKAFYTDGTSEFIYEKDNTNTNGYEIVDGDKPLQAVSEVIVKYENNGVVATASIPITVVNNAIESINATYTGPRVDVGNKYVKSLVLINVIYKNGSIESFYGDKTVSGSSVVTIYKKGTHDEESTIHDSGDNVEEGSDGTYINHFTAVYAGHEGDFEVTGIKPINQIDFSSSVAHGRRDAATWTETFRANKMKAVYDYVNEYAKTGDSGLATIEEKNSGDVTPAQINPLLWFEREGDWVEPVTNFIVEYQTRSSGFLFPNTGRNEDGSLKFETDDYVNMSYGDFPYLNSYNQDREQLRHPTSDFYKLAGWSDWVSNGDTAGTVNAKRIAYDYTTENPTTKSITMHTDSVKFRLNTQNGYTFKADENPQLKIYANGSTTPLVVTKDSVVTVDNLQTLRIELDGKVRVRNNKGVEELQNFKDMYRVGYKIGTANESYEWNNGWAGTLGINAECLEVKIQLSTAPIDEFSFTTTPYVATEPEDTSAIIGTSTMFTVKAVGQNLVYQWYKIDASASGDTTKAVAITGANQYYYQTPAVTQADNGSTYYCVVSNGSGSTTTKQAVLYTVDRLPEILQNLSDQAVEKGQSYTFSVAATCMIPSDLRYQWEMTQNDGTWQIVQPSSTSNSYTVESNETTHNKYIRCKITNSRGYVYTNPARISSIIEPSVEITAAKSIINVDSSTILTTYVSSYGGVPQYQWYVKNVTNGGTYELQDCAESTYTFEGKEAGEYKIKCVVKDSNGYSEEYSTIATNDTTAVSIKVGNTPKINSMTYSVTETGTTTDAFGTVKAYKANFVVDVSNSSFTGNSLRYEWYKNGQQVSAANSNTLTLTGLTENSQVTVMCKITDSFGYSYKSVQFKVGTIGQTTVK